MTQFWVEVIGNSRLEAVEVDINKELKFCNLACLS